MSRVKRTSGYLNINCYSGAIDCKMKCSSLFFAIIYVPRVEVLKYVIPTYMALIRSTYLRLRLWAALSKICRMMSFAYLSRLERPENTAWRSWTTHRICREVNFTGSHPACWSCGRVSPQRICPAPGALACGMTPSSLTGHGRRDAKAAGFPGCSLVFPRLQRQLALPTGRPAS